MSDNKRRYRPSPPGIGRFVWVNKPDTKYNDDGVFKTDIGMDGEAAATFKAKIDNDCDAAFEEVTADLTPKEKKSWEVHYPYEEEEDDAGNKTGRIFFKFRQNAVIKLKDGTRKPIQIAIYDAADKKVDTPVYSGSLLAAMYRPRNIKVTSSKKAGVRLDFLKVQVVKLADRDAMPGGFGEVEGGYVDDGEDEPYDPQENSGDSTADASGDY